jgi:pyruvate dehydrogenase E2 component (dihydrolipoamide acetyltransferase)
VNLGVAVAAEEGLTVAVLRRAETLDLKGLADATRDLVDRAREGKLKPEERTHATFTISNLGMKGVENFHPIINPPSAVTLAVPAALPRPVVRDGKVEAGIVMMLTISCDHRVLDGVVAAEFLKTLLETLEAPDALAE